MNRQSVNFRQFYATYFTHHKSRKNEWQVCCPFHEDQMPSMSINMDTGMYYCHGCGAKGDFIKFYMEKHGCGFQEAIKKLGLEPGENMKPKIVKTYDYLDTHGNLVSQTVRFEPKKFLQRTKKNGQWEWSLKGVKTVLYNLNKVIKAETVLILEGEKDCDTANELGYTATTGPMGAGKWQQRYNKYLKGKEVILIPDNDQVGIQHMIGIGDQLKNISTVRWFDFPGQHKKGFDFTDFVKSFGNEFEAMKEIDTLLRASRIFNSADIIIPEPDTEESESIKNWIKIAPGEFAARDIDYELGFTDPEQKIQRAKILEKFVAEKVLSREGKRRGVYRPYKKDLDRIDFLKADDKFIPLSLPMNIHKMVGIMPGNIIVIAGEANAGKTALMLNIIKMNLNKFDVHYFNSEMGAGELKSRLLRFEDIRLEEWNFNAYERDSNFSDVIFTGEKSLNIIDFLEVHEDFFAVGEKIKQIHTALHGGIAVIAIQKNKGAEFGLGGNRTMEKARLVINVEPGKFKITKAKNFINAHYNPNGLICDWKLRNGCEFVMQRHDWYKES